MKNLLKFTFLTAGLALGTSSIAQEIKQEARTTATQLEAPKPAGTTTTDKTTPPPAPASKQDPAKPAPKTDAKSDTTKTGGGTRMAITEQGMPKKNKKKAAANTPDAKAEPKKKEN